MLPLLFAAGICGASAQNPADSASNPDAARAARQVAETKVIYVNGTPENRAPIDSARALIASFYIDQYRHFQDPAAPYFMFMSKDANVAMGMGGVVRIRGFFDWNGSIPANGFAPYLIPIPANPAQMKRLAATPAGTSLFLTAFGRRSPFGSFMAFIQGNFNGYNHTGFELKKAYIQVGDWTAGYASSTFEDASSQAPTIDGAGQNGQVSRSTVLLRYFHTFRKGFSLGGGIEFPQSQIESNTGKSQAASDWVPDFVALTQYSWDGGHSHIRLSGVIRTLSYRNLVEEKNHNLIGWGVQLSGKAALFRKLNLFAQTVYGKGIESYTGDMAMGNFDLVASDADPAVLVAPRCLGVTAGLQYYITPKVFACAALGEMRYYDRTPEPTAYKYGLYGAFNVFWDITSRFQIGAEFLAAKRMNFNGQHRPATRLDAFFQLSF